MLLQKNINYLNKQKSFLPITQKQSTNAVARINTNEGSKTYLDLNILFQGLYQDENVLEEFLSDCKHTIVERVIDEMYSWDQAQPKYQTKMVELIYQGQYKLVKSFLKKKISLENFLTIKPELELQHLQEQLSKEQQNKLDQNDDAGEGEDQIIQDGLIFKFPTHMIRQFIDYLDPFSVYAFAQTCQEFKTLIIDDKNTDRLFKKFSIQLYSIKPSQVPLQTPFQELVKLVNLEPNHYRPELINLINDDVRKLIWSDVPKYQEIIKYEPQLRQVGKLFKSFKQCFEKAPRVNYCGIYAIKEKYLKFGVPDINCQHAPVHVVEYYRFLRFWSDGTISMMISNKKLNKADIIKVFSIAIENNQQQIPIQQGYHQFPKAQQMIRGEFIVDIDKVFIKTQAGKTVFSFDLQIRSSKQGPSDIMIVLDSRMQLVGQNYVYDLKQNSGTKFYQYKHIKEFRKDLPDIGFGWKEVTY